MRLASQRLRSLCPSARDVTQLALADLCPLVQEGACPRRHSHFSQGSSTWEARKASRLLHLVLVTLGVYRSTLLSRFDRGESFSGCLHNGVEVSSRFPPVGGHSQGSCFLDLFCCQ